MNFVVNFMKRGLVALVLFLFFPGVLLAQGPRIALTPLVFEFTGEPGEMVQGSLRVSNHPESVSVNILMEIEDMFPEGEEGRVRLEAPLEERTTFSLSPWIETEPSKFRLESGEEQEVQFTINVPEDAEPGGYYVSVVAGTTDIDPGGTGVAVLTRIGALILMTVPGEAIEDLRVLDLTATIDIDEGLVKLSTRFENKGTVHIRPEASIIITNMMGQEVAKVPLEGNNVLPNAVRRIDVDWEAGLRWGKHTATLEGVYGASSLPLDVVSVSFWMFSWKMVGIILGSLLFLILTRKRWLMAFRIIIKGEASSNRGRDKANIPA